MTSYEEMMKCRARTGPKAFSNNISNFSASDNTRKKQVLSKYIHMKNMQTPRSGNLTVNTTNNAIIHTSSYKLKQDLHRGICFPYFHNIDTSRSNSCSVLPPPINIAYNMEEILEYTQYNYTDPLNKINAACRPDLSIRDIFASDPVPSSTTYTGRAFDGYLSRAAVKVYALTEYISSAEPEISTTTDACGNFIFTSKLANKLVVVSGGTDLSIGQTNTIILKVYVPNGTTDIYVSPISTLIADALIYTFQNDRLDKNIATIYNNIKLRICRNINISHSLINIDPLFHTNTSETISLIQMNTLLSQTTKVLNIETTNAEHSAFALAAFFLKKNFTYSLTSSADILSLVDANRIYFSSLDLSLFTDIEDVEIATTKRGNISTNLAHANQNIYDISHNTVHEYIKRVTANQRAINLILYTTTSYSFNHSETANSLIYSSSGQFELINVFSGVTIPMSTLYQAPLIHLSGSSTINLLQSEVSSWIDPSYVITYSGDTNDISVTVAYLDPSGTTSTTLNGALTGTHMATYFLTETLAPDTALGFSGTSRTASVTRTVIVSS